MVSFKKAFEPLNLIKKIYFIIKYINYISIMKYLNFKINYEIFREREREREREMIFP